MTIARGSASVACALLAALLLFAAPTLLAQTNSTLGRWILNVGASKFSPGPPLTNETRIYEVYEGDGIKATFNRVDAAGNKLTLSYSAKYDGKDYPYTGSPDADTITLKRIDANVTEAILKKRGTVVQTTKAVVSPDGKTRTLTTTGVNAKGEKVNNVLVFVRR